MTRVSISYGFGNENRYNLSTVPKNIQLSLYKYELYSESKIKELQENNININVVHLPLDTLKRDPYDMVEFINVLHYKTGVTKFVIHPNKLIKSFVKYWMEFQLSEQPKYQLCIENFEWKSNKEMRSPLKILEYCIKYPEHIKMCFDTCHTEEIWFDHKILHTLLPYISVIHLSNRHGRQKHMPFNSGNGDLNLMSFVNHLKFVKWSGDIVLEYMPDYSHKLVKNYYFLKEIING